MSNAATVQNKEKLNGAQRLEALENTIMEMRQQQDNAKQQHDQQMLIIADEFNKLNEQILAMAKRLNAIIKAGENESGINSDTVKDVMVAEAVKELKGKVDLFIQQGVLIRNDAKEIDDDTFVVAREEDSEGKEINPRTQFLVKALAPEAKKLVLGKKAGDSIKSDELKQVMYITEVYDLAKPKVQEETDSPEVQSDAEAPAVGAEVIRTKTKKTKKA